MNRKFLTELSYRASKSLCCYEKYSGVQINTTEDLMNLNLKDIPKVINGYCGKKTIIEIDNYRNSL